MVKNAAGILGTLMATTAEAAFVVDRDGRLVLATPRFLAAVTASSGVLGKDFAAVAGAPAAALVRATLAAGAMHVDAMPLANGDGELVVHPVVEDGAVVACLGVLALPGGGAPDEGFDALTGLPNRRLFLDRVEQTCHAAQRAGKSAAVLICDVDRFGEIADALGQAAADAMTGEIAQRLRQCVRTSDTVARLGNERFAFVMQIAAINDSMLVMEKIQHAFETPFAVAGHGDVAATCSVGIGIFPADSETPGEVAQHAAVALNHARRDGGGRCQFFSKDMNMRARHRLEIESGLRRALSQGELLAYYQPKVDIATRRIAGMEALVRWQHPARGLVPPGEFIPVAEESGLIEQIGQWVLEETCAQSRRWQDEGLSPVRASVNVSARQFRNANFVAVVEDVLARTGLAPRWLELEITESMLIGDIAAIVKRMEDLRRVGVSLSIDDFGTGYSSLSYLSRFPITTLKIDRAFIADVQTNAHTAEIVRAIIGLSRGLQLEVVAEGAEVGEQVDFLRDHGCDLVQGYYYSRPLPAGEFAAMLRGEAKIPER